MAGCCFGWLRSPLDKVKGKMKVKGQKGAGGSGTMGTLLQLEHGPGEHVWKGNMNLETWSRVALDMSSLKVVHQPRTTHYGS